MNSIKIYRNDDGFSGLDALWENSETFNDEFLNEVYELCGQTQDDITVAEIEEIAPKSFPELTIDASQYLDEFERYLNAVDLSFEIEVVDQISNQRTPLTIAGLSEQEVQILKKYNVPTTEAEFSTYLAKLKNTHQDKNHDGRYLMVYEYLADNHCMNSPEGFIATVESDVDPHRKKLLQELLKEQKGTTESARAQALIERAFSDFNIMAKAKSHPTNIGLDLRGAALRTTSQNSYQFSWPEVISILKLSNILDGEQITRVLIVGPGLQFSMPYYVNKIPRQMYEPPALLNALRQNDVDTSGIRIDLIDIDPSIAIYVGERRVESLSGKTWDVYAGVYGKDIDYPAISQDLSTYWKYIQSTPSQDSEVITDGYGWKYRKITVSSDIWQTINMNLADVTVDALPEDTYDLIVCFNTFYYFDQSELVLAKININRALKDGGILLTDSYFHSDPVAGKTINSNNFKEFRMFNDDYPTKFIASMKINIEHASRPYPLRFYAVAYKKCDINCATKLREDYANLSSKLNK